MSSSWDVQQLSSYSRNRLLLRQAMAFHPVPIDLQFLKKCPLRQPFCIVQK